MRLTPPEPEFEISAVGFGDTAEADALYRGTGWTEIARYGDNPHARHWFEKRIG